MSLITGLYVPSPDLHGSASCGLTSALNNTRAVKQIVAKLIIGVPEITAYDAKKERGRASTTCKLFL